MFDNDDTGKRWSNSVTNKQFEILCVSQFTLYCTLKGNKPDFHKSMEANKSKILYDSLLEKLKQNYLPEKIQNGVFGALMEVNIVNDGPVTINIESTNNQQQAKNNSVDLNEQ